MDYQVRIENAVAAIRVSSVKQGIQGDSPEAQKEQIEQYARNHNINIKKFFIFLESASKEEQPVQEAIDYCKHPKNDIQLFIIKSIDRFTRGGSFFYDSLKRQLELNQVKLVDIYGIIGTQKVNTLEHLGVAFDWSVYSPTKKAEILEAERAKDEMRDIMSRMIGAEIRYSRMGYWVRRSPFGYVNEKIETANGKRTILKPHPIESKWIIKMFQLRAQGTHTDRQIVKIVNDMGYKTRIELIRDPEDRTKIIRKKGGNPLTLKVYWEYIKNPVYAGIHAMNWTKKNPVKAKYDGLISVEMFNKANRGRVVISEEDHEIKIYQNINPRYLVKQGIRNPDFPYKRVVLCPKCHRPFFGSASRGRLGKYYPAYHCNKRGHYFRIPKNDFEDNIVKLVRSLEVSQSYIDTLVNTVTSEWEKRQKEARIDQSTYDIQIDNLKGQVRIAVDKIKLLNSETAIKYMEEDIVKLEQEIASLLSAKQKAMISKPMDAHVVMTYVRYFLEHFDNLLLDWEDPEERASHFGVLFDETPTYQEIVSGTPKLSEFIKLKEVFMESESELAGEPGLEPRLTASKAAVLPLDDSPIIKRIVKNIFTYGIIAKNRSI